MWSLSGYNFREVFSASKPVLCDTLRQVIEVEQTYTSSEVNIHNMTHKSTLALFKENKVLQKTVEAT